MGRTRRYFLVPFTWHADCSIDQAGRL